MNAVEMIPRLPKPKEPPPTKPCHVCGNTIFWWQPYGYWSHGQWLCVKCHPQPENNDKGVR